MRKRICMCEEFTKSPTRTDWKKGPGVIALIQENEGGGCRVSGSGRLAVASGLRKGRCVVGKHLT